VTTALTTLGDDAGLPGALSLPGAGAMAPGPVRQLSKPQKAAIIVRLLLAEGATLSLTDLPESLQAELTHQMSSMRFIDRGTLKSVIDDFVAEVEDIGLSFPSGLEGALSVLDGTISAATAARVRKMSGVKLTGDPWQTICAIDSERLLPVLEEESPEIAAVLLSKLKVSTAAELLGRLPGARARRITYAISLTGAIEPLIVEKIGRALAEQLDVRQASAFTDGPVERVGAILNFSPAATRDEVLEGLDQDDRNFAREVRKAIFTFANIPTRIDPRDIPKITRDIDQQVLVAALAGAAGPLESSADFILDAMSKRMAEQMREEMEGLGAITPADGEDAMNKVVAVIRQLEEAGEIILLAEEE